MPRYEKKKIYIPSLNPILPKETGIIFNNIIIGIIKNNLYKLTSIPILLKAILFNSMYRLSKKIDKIRDMIIIFLNFI